MALAIFLVFILIGTSSAEKLQNPGFESPPSNITSNSTAPFLLLTKFNTIPGWSFKGTVRYITSSTNISLPGNGHGIQLGKGGKINQTFRGDNFYTIYVLTFSLAPGNKYCLNETVAVNVSALGRSKVFSLQRHYGKEMWESHAYFLGLGGSEKDLINLEIVSVDTDANDTCSPIVDTFMIKNLGSPIVYGDNMLYNGGLEVGPAFLKNSTEGILLYDEPQFMESPIAQWSVIGTVKYINTKYYSVPEGKAAVELVSDSPSGILKSLTLPVGSKYKLYFTIGDANNSCLGEFKVQAQFGNNIQTFTMISNGTGSAKKYSMTFRAIHSSTDLSFVTFNQSRTRDNVLCGPVIDDIIMLPSSSHYQLGGNLKNAALFPCLFFIITLHLLVWSV